MVELQNIAKTTGDYVSNITGKILNYINSKGIVTSQTTAKIITLIILLISALIIIKFVHTLKTPIKFTLVALIIFLAVSVAFSLAG